MNWSARFSWLMALRAARTARPASGDDDDIADMGTAFGLDASFDALPPEARAARDAEAPPVSPLESRLVRRTGL